MTLDEKAEVIRSLFSRLGRRDIDGVVACFQTDGELDFSRSRGLGRGVYRRHHQLRKFYSEMREMWDEWEANPEDFVELDDGRILSTVHGRMRGRDGISLEVQGAGVGTFRDGHLARWVFFQSREDAEAEIGQGG